MDWGHYNDVADTFEFILFTLAWSLLIVDLLQQVNRWYRRMKERAQWK